MAMSRCESDALRCLTTAQDIHYDYMHSGCPTPSSSGVMIALTGCTSKLGWGKAYCGSVVDRAGPDFLSSTVNEASTDFPRTIVPASMVNGDEIPEVKCWSTLECINICETLARTARTGNLPIPEACALCDRASRAGHSPFLPCASSTVGVH